MGGSDEGGVVGGDAVVLTGCSGREPAFQERTDP